MPAKKAMAGKPWLFILTILSVLALGSDSLLMLVNSAESAFVEVESSRKVLLQMNKAMNAADHAPNETIGNAPVLIEKGEGYVVSAKKLKPDIEDSQQKRQSYVAYTDSCVVYFMRVFNRLWDIYWVATWTKKGDFTFADAQNLKVLIAEYEELRRYLQLFAYESSAGSASFQDDFNFWGDMAIRHRIHAARHVLEAWEREEGMASSNEIKRPFVEINKMIAWSNQEVEKMNMAYANYLKNKSNPSVKKGTEWADDLSQKYAYKVDG